MIITFCEANEELKGTIDGQQEARNVLLTDNKTDTGRKEGKHKYSQTPVAGKQ